VILFRAVEIEAVFLDLGNVLVFHDDARLLGRLAALGGATEAQVRQRLAALWDDCYRGRVHGDALIRAVSDAAGVPLDAATFVEIWNCHFRVHDEVLPAVEALASRRRVLLLSNTNAAHFDWLRPRLPVLERFHDLVLSYEVGLAKPEPAIFHEALRRARVAPERAAFFDDVPAYVEAARALGIHGRLFTDAPRFRAHLAELGLGSP
jgi:putative hydrolase of the HAD superfamily